MSRPSKLIPEVIETVYNLIADGNYSSTAARIAGIAESTFYSWLKQGEQEPGTIYEEFAHKVEEAEAKREQALVQIVVSASKQPQQWKAAAWLLEKTAPERYGASAKVNIHHEGEVHLDHALELPELFKQFSDGEFRLLERLLAKASVSSGDDGAEEGESEAESS